jgi:hypothetical protein
MRPLTSGLAISAALSVLSFIASSPVLAQMRHTTAPSDPHLRIYAIVPLIGAGTAADPKRPMFVSATGLAVATPALPSVAAPIIVRTGIIGYHAQITDDGQAAIVEFIAPNASAFQEILASTDTRVQVFRKGIDSISAIQTAFQARKKDFSFNTFQMGVH